MALAAAVTILVALLLVAVYQTITADDPDEIVTEYQNEDWQVPPATDSPPEIPMPESLRQARIWLTDNPIYEVTLASPVRCELDLLPGGKVTDAELQIHLDAYMACLTKVWGPALEQAGYVAYQPQVTVYPQGEEVATACGDAPSVNAFYCALDQRLYIAQDILDMLPKDSASARIVFDLIMAHEYGHAIQGRTGMLLSERWLASEGSETEMLEWSRRTEVQADCFAGLAMNSLSQSLGITDEDREDVLTASYHIGDDQLAERLGQDPDEPGDHGSGKNRKLWAQRGLDNHTVSTCNSYSAPNSEVS